MNYNLFLDDERKPSDVKWVELPLVEWVTAKNYDDFVRIVSSMGLPQRVSFDHDLAEEHYDECRWCFSESNILNRGKFRYDKVKEKTGYHCAKWLINYCIDRGERFPEFFIHTMNPAGKENILSAINSYKKIYEQ